MTEQIEIKTRDKNKICIMYDEGEEVSWIIDYDIHCPKCDYKLGESHRIEGKGTSD